MSMSVEQVMYNYQKKIEQLKININFVRENLTILLQQLKAIDASGLNCQQTEKYLKELDAIIAEIENNELVKTFSKQDHVELEQAKQVNFYLEQKKLRLAEIQQEVELLKIQVIEDETKQRVANLKNRLNLNHNQLEQELLAMFDDKQSQAIILSFFKENKSKLVNLSPTEIADIVKEEINNYRTTTDFVKNQYLTSFKEQVSRDKFVQAELATDLEQFSKLDLESSQELNKKALALQNKIITKQLDESARKHAISSILQSIQKRGFIVNNNDIRLVKENEDSVVIVYAKKVTGEEAIFKVYLDGRFTYKFEGYEGHAHDTDEQPFINDLSMYDVSLSKEQKKTYLNPDRLMNKAKMNVNNNTNKNKK
ncbi:hypothetical protein [Spiroplasma eriocheiris]|uniref:Uncharacterized protein n=1 Tax=Spiroplasma eriocheiris TaxID=315358 RepID=A0A0H3XND6_9MOLU|nr:hypothetical protein [Spiroplasma eriocheiris]AHF58287.1 hypothetical protein SPE_1175 [Spiroplasma eriocheiris CCTCC M 207170]AKM54722.1 hypothetical protein SERIO_v1c11730 [Spiroplasma eriocheiris]